MVTTVYSKGDYVVVSYINKFYVLHKSRNITENSYAYSNLEIAIGRCDFLALL